MSEFTLHLPKLGPRAFSCTFHNPHKDTNNKRPLFFTWSWIYQPTLFVSLQHFSLLHMIPSTAWRSREVQEEIVQWWISHWSDYKSHRHPSHHRNQHTGGREPPAGGTGADTFHFPFPSGFLRGWNRCVKKDWAVWKSNSYLSMFIIYHQKGKPFCPQTTYMPAT